MVPGAVGHPGRKGLGREHVVPVADLLVQLGEVGGAFAQHFFVRAGAKVGLAFEGEGLGVGYQEEVPELAPVGERGVDVSEGEVLELAMSEKGAGEGVDPTLVQIAPDEVVVKREPVHHGREDVGHGGVGHLGVLDVKDRRPLRSEGRGVEFAGLVEDRAGKEETGSAVFTSGERVVVALCGGDGSVGGLGAGFSGGALGGSGSDYLERGFVEEINSPNQGLEGRVGEGDFLFEVSGNPLRGEEYGVGEDRAAERGENLLSPEGDLVGNDSGLNGEGPQDDVVEPPAAALEIVLEAVNVALVDGSTDCRIRSKEDGNRDREGEQEERL